MTKRGSRKPGAVGAATAAKLKKSISMPPMPNATGADQRHHTIPIRADGKRRLLNGGDRGLIFRPVTARSGGAGGHFVSLSFKIKLARTPNACLLTYC
jgi:hypothetical protein